MFIVIYRPHNELNVNTKHIGPFRTYMGAEVCLSSLPAIGIHYPDGVLNNPGVKYIEELISLSEACASRDDMSWPEPAYRDTRG